MDGENSKRLFTFTMYYKNRGWMYLKLQKIQDIVNGEYSSETSEGEHPEGSYFNQYWTARRSRDGYTYLFRPFGGSNLALEDSYDITDLREIAALP